jgi:DNA integrity scanning protein DisA with diadenylate cyclase activity
MPPIKVDLEKVYDLMSSSFLDYMLLEIWLLWKLEQTEEGVSLKELLRFLSIQIDREHRYNTNSSHWNIHVFRYATLTTQLKLIFQPESNKHRTKMENQEHIAQRREIKVVLDDEITKTNERKLKICENHLVN